MEFRVLGSLEVVDHDGPVALGAPKQRALLAVLLLHRGEPVSSDRLIDEIWGEQPPASANKIVQGYVSNLRKLLGDGRVVTQGRGYLLRVEPGQTDVDRFEALVAEGRRALEDGDALIAGAVLREALAVWRGPALSDFAYQRFAQAEIAWLEESRLVVLEDRIDADLASGEHARLVGELERLVHEHPLRERLQGQLMLALYRSGRQADALETYHLARDRLIDELGLEPGRELKELERAILAHDPALEPIAPRTSLRHRTPAASGRHSAGLITAGAAALLVAISLVAVKLASSGTATIRVSPNSIAELDPRTGRVVAVVAVGTRPGPIAFDSGSLWTANLDDQTISRIDPGSLRTLGNIGLRAPPTGLAASAGGVWVVESPDPAQSSVYVERVDPEYNKPVRVHIVGNVVPSGPGAVAAQGGSVWVAPSNGLLTRLDALTGAEQWHVDPKASPTAIAVGAGAAWLTDTEADNVVRVDANGLVTPIPVGNAPTAIAVGEGAVWVVDSGDEAVVRIDPGTPHVTATIHVGRSPAGVAVGAGSVWVANGGDGTVTRINPTTDKAIATLPVGGSPQALTVADGRVWVTVDERSIAPIDTGAGGGTLRMVSFDDIDSMDPALAISSWNFIYATCAGLVNYPDVAGPAGSQLVPEVAQALPARSQDGRTYTFKIRRGFRFSPPSGQPVTAQTFKDSIERTLNPAMKSPFAPFLADIVGARQYSAGRAGHISGIVARGDELTIRLIAAAPDFLSRLALPAFCPVPSDTLIDPEGLRNIPSAGPYYVTYYVPGHGVVLARNPNYRGKRPHHFARIELSVGIPAGRAIDDIEAGTADFATLGLDSFHDTSAIRPRLPLLAAKYGARSDAAARGQQQYFVNPNLQLDYFALNTHRPLFRDFRVRQAVNYAIDRGALADVGGGFQGLPDSPTDHYLPPGMPGYRPVVIYRTRPDPAEARRLVRSAHAQGHTAVLYVFDTPQSAELAQIVTNDLGTIGIRVEFRALPIDTFYARLATPGEPYDLAYGGEVANYPDPATMLNEMLDGSFGYPSFTDPTYQRRLAAAGRLSGPQRYLTYGSLDLDLAHNAAPLVAYGNGSSHDFFSARIGCQTYGIYGMDLAALCIKGKRG